MNPRRRYVMLLLGVLGLSVFGRGIMLWNEAVTGNVIENWIQPSTVLPAHSNKWTWGVGGDPSEEPDEWHFHIFFGANDTSSLRLMWNLNQTILFQKNSSAIDEEVDISLPASNVNWRWDWLIVNPLTSALAIDNFTIIHYPVAHPERVSGELVMGVGVAIILLALVSLTYFRKKDRVLK